MHFANFSEVIKSRAIPLMAHSLRMRFAVFVISLFFVILINFDYTPIIRNIFVTTKQKANFFQKIILLKEVKGFFRYGFSLYIPIGRRIVFSYLRRRYTKKRLEQHLVIPTLQSINKHSTSSMKPHRSMSCHQREPSHLTSRPLSVGSESSPRF